VPDGAAAPRAAGTSSAPTIPEAAGLGKNRRVPKSAAHHEETGITRFSIRFFMLKSTELCPRLNHLLLHGVIVFLLAIPA
jgi:hypothetical protein